MNNMDIKTAKAIASLLSGNDFQQFVAWLEMVLSNRRAMFEETKDEIAFRWNQGYCVAFRQLLEAINSAPDYVESYNKGKTSAPHGKTSAPRKEQSWT